jgi:hypothetical protein
VNYRKNFKAEMAGPFAWVGGRLGTTALSFDRVQSSASPTPSLPSRAKRRQCCLIWFSLYLGLFFFACAYKRTPKQTIRYKRMRHILVFLWKGHIVVWKLLFFPSVYLSPESIFIRVYYHVF